MDRINKFLKRLTHKERNTVFTLLSEIEKGNIETLDIKKLKGHRNVFRVRKGGIRIIFTISVDKSIKIRDVVRRDDRTYNQ